MPSIKEIKEYFSKKAKDYDLVDEQKYWVLSDKVAELFLKDFIKDIDLEEINLLDAGAWTGRWSEKFYNIAKEFKKNIKGKLIDITPEMLEVAKNKFHIKWINTFSFEVWNIENLDKEKDLSYDVGISFYNVLSFVDNYNKVISEIFKKLKKGGYYIGIVANKDHARYFAISTGRLEELNNIEKNSKIRFNPDMPSIWCFDFNELKKVFKNNWFREIKVYGLLKYIYPWMEETYLYWENEKNKKILDNFENFNRILDIEYKNFYDESSVSRGNTLLFIARK